MSGKPRAIVTFDPDPRMRGAIEASLDGVAEVTYLTEAGTSEPAESLASADAVLAWALDDELRREELARLGSAGLIQLLSAGVDQIPLDQIPDGVAVASSAGAYAEPMASMCSRSPWRWPSVYRRITPRWPEESSTRRRRPDELLGTADVLIVSLPRPESIRGGASRAGGARSKLAARS